MSNPMHDVHSGRPAPSKPSHTTGRILAILCPLGTITLRRPRVRGLEEAVDEVKGVLWISNRSEQKLMRYALY